MFKVNKSGINSKLNWPNYGEADTPTLFFPFENPDKNFWGYIDKIIPYLPFQIEEKYLRIANVNKQGEVRSFKKIVRP